ncbi:flavin reductase [Nocardioides sp. CGMCC 1.13656]|nr:MULTISPECIES: flavin reductase [unclassified Nocardioides]MBA2953618.1 flavin reductase [Nocardioides sp. CGMCC 1.13656]
MVDPTTFRDVMAQWPSGVTVVTTLVDGDWHGMTASSFSSVSLDPPLVSVCLDRRLYSHGLISAAGVFGVNVLAKDQAEVARVFAGMVPGVEDRFAGESWTTAETGTPLLDSALGWLDCRVVHEYPGGDHTIFVGEVLAGHAARRTAPLLFHSRGWGQFADVLPDVATLADGGVVAALRGRGHSEEGVLSVAEGLAASGVRVRVLDLARDDRAPVVASLPDRSSALVATREQAEWALGLGVEVVEVPVDPSVPGAVDQVLTVIDGLADRASVIVRNAFAIEHGDAVLNAVVALSAARVLEIGMSDSLGAATPLQVRAVLQDAVGLARPVPLRARLGDRDRLGLVKALTALKSGVHHFNTTLAGLDGAVATEDLVRLLGELDVDTPADAAQVGLAADALRLSLVPTNPVGAAG